jgi:predicted transcriptional regulator of viral defense system
LSNKNQIKTVRNGIYYIVPLDDSGFYPDRIHIASNIRPDAVICCNSALIIHDLWQDTSKEPIIYLSSKYPTKIRIQETTYKIVKAYNFGITKEEYTTPYYNIDVKVTDIERTIIDCLRTRSLKISEMISLLKKKPLHLNINHIISYLEKFRKPILYNKVGLVLESAKNTLELNDDDITKIRKKLSKKIFYLREKSISLIRPKYKYYVKWNCMIPEELFNSLTSTNI